MTRRALIAYDTGEGHTAKIAHWLAEDLASHELEVDVFAMPEVTQDIGVYDGYIVGGSVHVSHFGRRLTDWVQDYAAVLGTRPSAFFSVSLTAAAHDAEHQVAAHDLAEEFLAKAGWTPDMLGLFGGALAYRQYGFIKRQFVKRVAKREGMPVDTTQDYDFTDWNSVSAFSDDFQMLLGIEPTH